MLGLQLLNYSPAIISKTQMVTKISGLTCSLTKRLGEKILDILKDQGCVWTYPFSTLKLVLKKELLTSLDLDGWRLEKIIKSRFHGVGAFFIPYLFKEILSSWSMY